MNLKTLTFLLVFAAWPCTSQGQDSVTEKTATAERLADIVGVNKSISPMIERVAAFALPDKRGAFEEELKLVLASYDPYRLTISNLTESFSGEELQSLVGFFSSPIGNLANDKYATFSSRLLSSIQRGQVGSSSDATVAPDKAEAIKKLLENGRVQSLLSKSMPQGADRTGGLAIAMLWFDYFKLFSTEELNQLEDFIQQPVTQSILDKYPSFLQKQQLAMAPIHRQIMDVAQRFVK